MKRNGLPIVIVLGVCTVFLLVYFNHAEAPQIDTQPVVESPAPSHGEPVACNADAKMCPDGSAVGRTGPDCEFAACPSPEARSATLTTYINGSPTALNMTVQPKEVVSDSRCPSGVQCIWAGTVEVRTVLSTQLSHGEHVMTLGKPQRFGDFDVTLTAVTPYPKAGEPIAHSAYRFTYEITKR